MHWTIQVQDGPMLAPRPVALFPPAVPFRTREVAIEHHGAARLQHAPFAARAVSTSLLEHPPNRTPNWSYLLAPVLQLVCVPHNTFLHLIIAN